MAHLKDFEGWPMPPDNDGKPTWGLSVAASVSEKEPYMVLDMPMWFEVPSKDDEMHEYNSFGIVGVDLREVLDDYLVDISHMLDAEEFEGAGKIAAMFREYADKIDAARASLNPVVQPVTGA